MATFVLVPGSWLGGWAWGRVTTRLRAEGHDVYAVTLTGLGEREHLGGPQVNLETHITDVVNLIKFEDLYSIILVGHSYAGIVITGVADRLPKRIARLIYVDSAPLPDGVAQADLYSPELRELYEQRVKNEGDGWRLPLPSWQELDEGEALDGLAPHEREFMRARATDMPYGAVLQPLRLSNPAREHIRKLAIWCTYSSAHIREMAGSGNPMFSTLVGPEWEFIDLPTGHWPMFSWPDELADLLLSAAPPA